MAFVSLVALQAVALPVPASDNTLSFRDNQSLYARPDIINPRIGTSIAPREDDKEKDDDDEPIVKNKKLLADLRSGKARAKRIIRHPKSSTSASPTSTTSSAAPSETAKDKENEKDKKRELEDELEARDLEDLELVERSPIPPPDRLPFHPRDFEDIEERDIEDELEAREFEDDLEARDFDFEFELVERSPDVSGSTGIISAEKKKELETGEKAPQRKQRTLTTEELQAKMKGPINPKEKVAMTTLEITKREQHSFQPPTPVMMN